MKANQDKDYGMNEQEYKVMVLQKESDEKEKLIQFLQETIRMLSSGRSA